MSVNSFDHEDSVKAAYDAAERVLFHALDVHEIFIMQFPTEQRQTIARLAVRVVDAVMHSSEADIADMFPQLVERGSDGSSDSVPEQTGMSTT